VVRLRFGRIRSNGAFLYREQAVRIVEQSRHQTAELPEAGQPLAHSAAAKASQAAAIVRKTATRAAASATTQTDSKPAAAASGA